MQSVPLSEKTRYQRPISPGSQLCSVLGEMQKAGVSGVSLGAVWLPRERVSQPGALADHAALEQASAYAAKRSPGPWFWEWIALETRDEIRGEALSDEDAAKLDRLRRRHEKWKRAGQPAGRPTRSPGVCVQAAAWRDVFGGTSEQVARLIHVSSAAATKDPVALGGVAASGMGLWPYSHHLHTASRSLPTDWWDSAEAELFALLDREARKAEIDIEIDAEHYRRALELCALVDMWPRVIGIALRPPIVDDRAEPAVPAGSGEYLVVDAGVAYRDERDGKMVLTIRTAKPIRLNAVEAARLCGARAVVPVADLAAYRRHLRIPKSELPDGSTRSERQSALDRRGL